MITRSKLVEQLRDNQIRSQHKWSPLVIFSPKPNISTWADVAVAILCAILFIVLVTASYMTLYFRHFWFSFAIICLGILIPIRLRISRQTIARKKDRSLRMQIISVLQKSLSPPTQPDVCDPSWTISNHLHEDLSREFLISMDYEWHMCSSLSPMN